MTNLMVLMIQFMQTSMHQQWGADEKRPHEQEEFKRRERAEARQQEAARE